MADSSTKLYYFKANGGADPIRFVLFANGVEFEDIRFTKEEWPKYKEELGEDCTFGQVPLLKYDGKVLTQRRAILYYLASKFNILPEGTENHCSTCWYLEVLEDLMKIVLKAVYTPNEEEKKALQEKILASDLPLYFKGIEKKFNADGVAGKGYLVVDKPTLADYAVICQFENMFYNPARKDAYGPVLAANAPNFTAWFENKLEEFNGYFTSKYRPPTYS